MSYTRFIPYALAAAVFALAGFFPLRATAAVETELIPAPDDAGLWGYVDANTLKTRIPARFVVANFFEDGLAKVAVASEEEPRTVNFIMDGETKREATVYPVGYGLIDRDCEEVLPARFTSVQPAGETPALKGIYLVNSQRFDVYDPVSGRIFNAALPSANPGNAVFHREKGWLLSQGERGGIFFYEDGAFSCDGVWYIDGKSHSAPEGCIITRHDAERRVFYIKRADKTGDNDERKLAAPSDMDFREALTGMATGVMSYDGRIIVPLKLEYTDVQFMPLTGLWVASRPTESGIRASIRLFASDMKDDIPESMDILTADVYNDAGNIVYSLSARYTPDVEGDELHYTHEGREYAWNASTGKSRLLEEEDVYNPPDSEFLVFEKDGRFGIRDKNGAVTAPPVYGLLNNLGKGVFEAAEKPSYGENDRGLIDHRGKQILPPEFRKIRKNRCAEGSVLTVSKLRGPATVDATGLFDVRDGWLTPVKYAGTFYFTELGQAVVSDAELSGEGVIDCRGKEVIPLQYKDIFTIKDKRKGHSDKVLPYYMAKRKDGLMGVLDASGVEVVPFQYNGIGDFFNVEGAPPEWLPVSVSDAGGRKHGAVNLRTKVRIEPISGYVDVFQGCIAVCSDTTGEEKEGCKLINHQGDVIDTFEEVSTLYAVPDRLQVVKNGLTGVADTQGRMILPCKYKSLSSATPGYWKSGTGVILDERGREFRIRRP
jgi:hypothetical protein